jgi:putative Mg2+ transporter-C (MgtC) family protein
MGGGFRRTICTKAGWIIFIGMRSWTPDLSARGFAVEAGASGGDIQAKMNGRARRLAAGASLCLGFVIRVAERAGGPVLIIALNTAAVNLSVAMVCGAVIGSERQVRQRMAGLRTNALVALGAASFVTFSLLFPHEVSQTRVAAQVVSGIGFLGAGIIFRDGFNIHGLNTAATLWCSAAVGLMAGASAWQFALLLTGMVVFINLGLRPLVKFIKRQTKAGVPHLRQYRVLVTCLPAEEAAVRGLILRAVTGGGLHLSEVAVQVAEGGLGVELAVTVTSDAGDDHVLELAVQRLAAEPGLARIRWAAVEDV